MKKTMKRKVILAAVPVLVLGGAVLVRAQGTAMDAADKRVYDKLNWVMHKRVSTPPGGSYRLKIVPTSRTDAGQFAEIFVAAKPARIKKLHLSEFMLRSTFPRVDVPWLFAERKVRTLPSARMKTTLRAVVSENDLTALLAQGERTKSMNLKVKYIGTTLRVTGNLDFTFLRGPVVGLGKLRLGSDEKVYLDILTMKLNGAEVPSFVKQKFSEKINPVIDYEDVPFAPKFKGVRVQGPLAIITA